MKKQSYDKGMIAASLMVAIAIGLLLFKPSKAEAPRETTQSFSEYKQSIIKVVNPVTGGGGTGFAVRSGSGKLAILTNAHVCLGASDGDVVNIVFDEDFGGSGVRVYRSRIVAYADVGDLCLVLAVRGMPALPIANFNPQVGEDIKVIGHPLLQPLTPSKGTVIAYDTTTLAWPLSPEKCKGVGYELKQGQDIFGTYEVCTRTFYSGVSSAIIYPGNSGSPMFNEKGEVDGVLFASDGYTHYGVFIPISVVHVFLNQF